VNEYVVRDMKNSGCVSISYGFESGSPRMLKSMNKIATIEKMEQAIKVNRKYGMMLPVSFIIGMPEEDEESCRETVEFCVRNSIPLKSIMFATPYPGTQLFNYALESGKIQKDRLHDFVVSLEDARDFTINLTNSFTDEQLIAKRQEMIDEVSGRLKPDSIEVCNKKLRDLFGNLVDDYLKDEVLLKHRATHGGIDIF